MSPEFSGPKAKLLVGQVLGFHGAAIPNCLGWVANCVVSPKWFRMWIFQGPPLSYRLVLVVWYRLSAEPLFVSVV